MTTHTHLSIETHFRFSTSIVKAAERALKQAEETGSTRDFLDAIKTAIMVQDFSGRELIRYKLRKQVAEAAAVLNGEFDGQEDVRLGQWADECSPEDIGQKAEMVVDSHRELYS